MKAFAVILVCSAILPGFASGETSAADWISQGNAKVKTGDLGGALADYNRAIGFEPKLAAAYDGRAVIKAVRGALSAAVEDESRALELAPNESHPYCIRGNAKRANGDLDGAIADYDRAIELNPGDHLPYLNRGIARCLKSEWSEAFGDFRRSYELNPKVETYARLLSWVARSHVGQAQEAKQELADYFNQQPEVVRDWSVKVVAFLCDNVEAGNFLDSVGITVPKDGKYARQDPNRFLNDFKVQSRGHAVYDSDFGSFMLVTGLPPYPRMDFPKRCQAWFYTGMKRLLAGDKESAKQAFQDCGPTRQVTLAEYQLAQAELKELTN
jgi:tetratricopeptide (TPR) repeat protein